MPKIKAVFKCPESEKDKFKDASCLLTISVGQQTHEGEYFNAIMELIQASFDSCVIIIDDSLQRHTMALNQEGDADYFYDISITEGDLWLKRHEKYLQDKSVVKKIFRWDAWLKHQGFSRSQQQIRSALATDSDYKSAFDSSISNFLKKYQQRLVKLDNFDFNRAQKLCLDFIVEECSALCLWSELGCQFEIYPYGHNAAIEATRRKILSLSYPDLLHDITVVFKNAKQLRPQSFELL